MTTKEKIDLVTSDFTVEEIYEGNYRYYRVAYTERFLESDVEAHISAKTFSISYYITGAKGTSYDAILIHTQRLDKLKEFCELLIQN